MTCPIPTETLIALFSHELGEAEADAVTEHAFACERCGREFERVARLVEGLREVIPFVISHAQRDRLVAEGTRIRVTNVEANTSPTALFANDVDLLVHALRMNLARVDRVDVDVLGPSGEHGATLENVPFDRAAGEVLIACQRHFEGMFPGDPIFRVHAIEAGAKRTIG
ncbi:MAG TPA: hypothetical protein VFQ65_15250, partial [Kofleriaceae bacterium]|nr:hypothetical protein [Kofleriaceae bacterium]